MMNQGSSHKPRKRFGQNFLQDAAIIERIVDAIRPERGGRLVEIGPGQGAITNRVLARMEDDQALVVVELDRDLAAVFQERALQTPTLEVIQADILKVDLADLLRAESGQVKLFGNLPYNISSPLLIRLVETHVRLLLEEDSEGICSDMVFMLQKEVVDRIVAKPGSKTYGRLSVVIQSVFDAAPLFDVPPKAFYPSPKVMSSILRLSPKREPLVEAKTFRKFQKIVTAAFAQRRKTLKNTLRGIAAEQEFSAAQIDPSLRAETLAVEDFVRLSHAIHDDVDGESGITRLK